MRKKIIALTALCALAAPLAAADEASGTLNVTATVLNTCAVTTSPVSFVNVGLETTTANGSVTVTCTNSDGFTVALDGGDAADISARTLSHDTETASFTYQLYTDAGFTTVWGDGTTGSTNAGTGPSDTLIVYGQTTGTPQVAGTYSDSVQVTVTF